MIGVHIFGVHARDDMIAETLKKIPSAKVHYDDKFGQPHGMNVSLYAARLAWLAPLAKGETHRVVITDDTEVCDGFMAIVRQIVKAHPEKIIALFPIEYMTRRPELDTLDTPYIYSGSLSGQAVIMPAPYIAEWDKWCRARFPAGDIPDDTSIRYFAEETGKQYITTIPAIVQHIGDTSLIPGNGGWIRRTVYFAKKPQADWSCQKIAKRL